MYHKKNSKIDTISVDILFYFISNQINDIKLMGEESKEEVFTQRNGGALLLHKEKKNDGDNGTNESWHSNYSTDGATR